MLQPFYKAVVVHMKERYSVCADSAVSYRDLNCNVQVPMKKLDHPPFFLIPPSLLPLKHILSDMLGPV